MEGKKVRRRFVQSTLFPELGSSAKVSQSSDNRIWMKEEDCSAVRKKRKGCSMKSSQKSTETDSEDLKIVGTSSYLVVDENSPVASQSNSFIKASDEKLKSYQDELLVSPEGNGVICLDPDEMSTSQRTTPASASTPRKEKTRSTPRKEQGSSTPRKYKRSSTPNKRTKSSKSESGGLLTDAPPSQGIPNLRLEALLAAEETSQMFAGRKTHPFFTSWKGVKSSQDLANSESVKRREERGLVFHPIHIFQNSDIKDESGNLDWGCWVFSERSSVVDIQYNKCSSVYEGAVGPLNLNRFLNGFHSFGRVSTDGKTLYDEGFGFHAQDNILQERIMSHYHASHSQLTSSLWTHKYRPQNSKQICGNVESVVSITEWLQQWHKKDISTRLFPMDDDDSVKCDIDDSYQLSDSDTYDTEDILKNVLLVTGPVGSGKSAAIYACARDQGFHIIENNASDWRSGVLVKQKFGEAMESHWRHCAVKSAENLPSSMPSKSIEVVDVDSCSDNEVTEIAASHKEDNTDPGFWYMTDIGWENGPPCHQNDTKALILFEDVDACLSEDHGFISSIQQLAETAKRPIILTCNSENPVLPKNLDRSHVRFNVPSSGELLELVYSICAAEKANIHPSMIERCVHCCQGDIRKTLFFIQFWWQGLMLGRGKKRLSEYSPVPFDVDAGHQILPRVIPGGRPSLLSAAVAEEFDKSLNGTSETRDLDGSPSLRIKACTDKSPTSYGRRRTRRKLNPVLCSDSEDDIPSDFKAEVLSMEDDVSLSRVHEIPVELLTKSEAEELQFAERMHESDPLSPLIFEVETFQETKSHRAEYNDHPVEETWKRLRRRHPLFLEHVTEEEKSTGLRVLKLAHGLIDSISEADLLFRDCRFLLSDSFESEGIHNEEIYDDGYGRLEISSVAAEHAMCFYAEEIFSYTSEPLDLASEMLLSSTSSIALGKLACLVQTKVGSWGSSETIRNYGLLSTGRRSRFDDGSVCNLLRSVVPLKSYLSSKGSSSLHEYMSALSRISRIDASRRVNNFIDNPKQRSGRVARHYLSDGTFAMSPGDILKLQRLNNYYGTTKGQ